MNWINLIAVFLGGSIAVSVHNVFLRRKKNIEDQKTEEAYEKERVSNLQAKLRRLQKNLEDQKTEGAYDKERAGCLQMKLHRLERRFNTAKESNGVLQCQLNEANHAISVLKNDLVESSKRIELSDAEKEQLRELLKETQEELSHRKQELYAALLDRDTFESRLKSLNEKVQEKQCSEIETLTAERDKLKEENEKFRHDFDMEFKHSNAIPNARVFFDKTGDRTEISYLELGSQNRQCWGAIVKVDHKVEFVEGRNSAKDSITKNWTTYRLICYRAANVTRSGLLRVYDDLDKARAGACSFVSNSLNNIDLPVGYSGFKESYDLDGASTLGEGWITRNDKKWGSFKTINDGTKVELELPSQNFKFHIDLLRGHENPLREIWAFLKENEWLIKANSTFDVPNETVAEVDNTPMHVVHVCKINCGHDQCRYLGEDKNRKPICHKLTPEKHVIDREIEAEDEAAYFDLPYGDHCNGHEDLSKISDEEVVFDEYMKFIKEWNNHDNAKKSKFVHEFESKFLPEENNVCVFRRDILGREPKHFTHHTGLYHAIQRYLMAKQGVFAFASAHKKKSKKGEEVLEVPSSERRRMQAVGIEDKVSWCGRTYNVRKFGNVYFKNADEYHGHLYVYVDSDSDSSA